MQQASATPSVVRAAVEHRRSLWATLPDSAGAAAFPPLTPQALDRREMMNGVSCPNRLLKHADRLEATSIAIIVREYARLSVPVFTVHTRE